MNSTIITRALLLARPELLAAMGLGAAARIVVGVIPASAALPAIGVTEVSAAEHLPLAGDRTALVTGRAQITVAASSIKEVKALLAQARYACRNFVGTVAGVPSVKCLLLESGPDFEHEAGFAMQSQDVRVTFRDVPSG